MHTLHGPRTVWAVDNPRKTTRRRIRAPMARGENPGSGVPVWKSDTNTSPAAPCCPPGCSSIRNIVPVYGNEHRHGERWASSANLRRGELLRFAYGQAEAGRFRKRAVGFQGDEARSDTTPLPGVLQARDGCRLRMSTVNGGFAAKPRNCAPRLLHAYRQSGRDRPYPAPRYRYHVLSH